MAGLKSVASTAWNGDLAAGSGMVEFASGGIVNSPVSWASRTEAANGKTSPEELIAGAHSSCYAMAFAHTLTTGGNKPEHLFVTSTVDLQPKDGGGFQVVSSALQVRGKVPGLSQDEFAQIAVQAEQGCPISNALRSNVQITVDATLET
jgi:osmotically inducible protein OsmC